MDHGIDASFRLLAARCLRKQAKRLSRQLEGVRRADDVECVHQTRVASRRLQAALKMFRNCLEPDQRKRWRKEIRRVVDRLGEARDGDVQIEYLCRALRSVDRVECYPGIARLLSRTERRRERLQKPVLKAVDRLQSADVLEEMRRAAKQLAKGGGRRPKTVRSETSLRITGQRVVGQLEKLLRHEDGLADCEAKGRHHAMRIAAKRLRYTMEIAGPVYEGGLDEAVKTVKKLQVFLGDVHDCDVWIERLDDFDRSLRRTIRKRYGTDAPAEPLTVGIDYLRSQRQDRRERAFRDLVDYWRKLQRQDYWGKLAGDMVYPKPGDSTRAAAPLLEPHVRGPVAAASEPADASAPAGQGTQGE